MKHQVRRTPSASMVVSVVALVVALSGTAVAASSLVSGDKLIKKRSLSGNRLRNHTVTGKQIKVSSLGKVPSAKVADSAKNATNASNAAALDGQGPAGFDASTNWARSGLVSAGGGQVKSVVSFGPFNMALKCTNNGGNNYTADIEVTSSEPQSEADGQPLGPGQTITMFGGGPSGTTFSSFDGSTSSFVTGSGKAYQAIFNYGVYYPGVSQPCAASALVGKAF